MANVVTDQASATEIVEDTFNRLRASLFSIVESIGLPRRQEVAFKTQLRYRTYQDEAILKEIAEHVPDEVLFNYATKYLESLNADEI